MISFTAFKLFILIVYVWFAVGIAVISVFAIRELFSWFKVPNEHISQSIQKGPRKKREATPKVDKVDVVPQGWGNPVEVFEHALEHEKHVSRLIDELVQVASEEKDNATQDFLWQFVREQVEDEANVLNIVSHLRKAGDCAILFMDAKLGERES